MKMLHITLIYITLMLYIKYIELFRKNRQMIFLLLLFLSKILERNKSERIYIIKNLFSFHFED